MFYILKFSSKRSCFCTATCLAVKLVLRDGLTDAVFFPYGQNGRNYVRSALSLCPFLGHPGRMTGSADYGGLPQVNLASSQY